NTYDNAGYYAKIPVQVGSSLLTNGTISQDYPSPTVGNQYVGKFTTPRCGRPDEIFMAYTPTSANGKSADNQGNTNIYHSYIAYRPNLNTFNPLDPVNIATESGLRIVINDVSHQYTLVWPAPVLSWQARSMDVEQQFSPSIRDPNSTVVKGMPF